MFQPATQRLGRGYVVRQLPFLPLLFLVIKCLPVLPYLADVAVMMIDSGQRI